jgi:CRP-like cAMP-binding protein
VIVEQGEPGHCFYVVDQGEVLVQVPGQPDRRLGPGDGFGEIALLRDVPRTATVTAVGDVRLAGIARDRFLAVVTGDERSATSADAVVAEHLGRSLED